MAKSTIQSLERKLSSGQVMPTPELLTLLDQHGFISRRSKSGTSHIVVWNPEHRDMPKMVIPAGTKKLVYQRDAIKACIEILKAKTLINDDNVDLVESFEDAAQDDYDIPPELEVIRGPKRNSFYLRHKEFPQLAMPLIGYQMGDDVSKECDAIKTCAEEFEETLRIAEHEKGFDIERFPNGTILLNNRVYTITEVIYPFTPRLENIEVAEKLGNTIAEFDLEQEHTTDVFNGITKNFGLEEIETSDKSSRRFTVKRPFDKSSEDIVSLRFTERYFISFTDVVRFITAVQDSKWKRADKNLKKHFGYQVTTTADGKLKGHHPISNIDFTVTNPRSLPTLEEDIARYFTADDDDRDEIEKALFDKHNAIEIAHSEVLNALRESQQITDDLMRKSKPYLDVLEIAVLDKGFVYGEQAMMNCVYKGKKFRVPMVPVTGGSRKDPQMIATQEAYDILQKEVTAQPAVSFSSTSTAPKPSPPKANQPFAVLANPPPKDPILKKLGIEPAPKDDMPFKNK